MMEYDGVLVDKDLWLENIVMAKKESARLKEEILDTVINTLDKVEFKDIDRLCTCYLMTLCDRVPPHKQHTLPFKWYEVPVWEARLTRTSHLFLISEKEIIRKISSNFDGFYPKEK